MQLLDTFPYRSLAASDTLLKALNDIVSNIKINSNFCISHPNYQPLELVTEVVERFQRVSPETQQKYLSLQVQNFLYGIYYNGSLKNSLSLNTSSNLALQQLENNTFLGVDTDFYNQLHNNNSGKGYFDPGWRIVRKENDGSLVVMKGGLNLHIQREKHLKIIEQAANVGEVVAI